MFNLSRNSLSDPANFPNRLKCLQINLRHSSLASASLAQVILDFEIDIVLIQEPYALPSFPPVVVNPPGFSSYHQPSDDHAYGSAILIRDSIAKAGKLDCRHFSNFAACVELKTNAGPLRLASIYRRPSMSNFSASVTPILDVVAAPFAIIGSDANARSQLWNSKSCDKRGSELVSMLATFKLKM